MRNTTINLMNCNFLDNSYNHTVDFENSLQQKTFFNRYIIMRIDNNSYVRKNTNIKIGYNIEELRNVNYCSIVNNNKTYYYFVNDLTYISENATECSLQLDVIQTYMFDYSFKESFIERCHVDRWRNDKPTFEVEEEDLQLGDYILKDKNIFYNFSTKGSYIISCSDVMGVTEQGGNNGGNGSGGNGNGGNYLSGIPSSSLFRFIKGYEAFGEYPYADSGGVMTYGYGVTNAEQEKYNSMLPAPVSEQKASEVLGEILINSYSKQVFNRFVNDGVNFDNIKQQHFDAFVSLCYNGGLGAVTSSPMYEKFLVNPNDESIIESWKNWYIRDNNGTVLEGLKLRRIAESNIYSNNQFEFRQIPKVNSNGVISGYVEGDGFIPDSFKSTKQLQEIILEECGKLIGIPYSLLKNDNTFTCNTFVKEVYEKIGVSLNTNVSNQFKQGVEVVLNDVKSGDLIFSNFINDIPRHVSIYAYKKDDKHFIYECGSENESVTLKELIIKNDMRFRRIIK